MKNPIQYFMYYFIFVCFSGLFADTFEVTNFTLVEKKRVSRVEFEYSFLVNVVNSGRGVLNLTGEVSSSSDVAVITDALVEFGDVQSGGTVTGANPFKIRINREYPFDENALSWTFTFEENCSDPANDFDNDGVSDICDDDDDNDGVDDENDDCPRTPLGTTVDSRGCPISHDVGISHGDPHFLTFDGLVYHDQSIGEFILTRTKTGNSFEVQARQQRISGWSPCVTLNTAVAIKTLDNIIEYRVNGDEILVNGSAILLSENDEYEITNNLKVKRSNGIICSDLASDITVKAIDRGPYINIMVYVNTSYKENLEGLFGYYDDNPENDQQLRDGTIALNFGAFIEDWRIQNDESLFTYPDGLSTNDYTAVQTCGIHLTNEEIEYARSLYHARFGENACDEAMVISIATDIAAGMPEEEVIEGLADIHDYVAPSGTMWYLDEDQDGFGKNEDFVVACTQPVGYVDNALDCDDANNLINPAATEIIGNDIDENCDGEIIYSEQIININARSSSGVTLALTSGTYRVTMIGTANGGAYNAWSAWSSGNQWLNTYAITSNELGTIRVNDGTRYSTAIEALNNAIDANFTLTNNENVRFYIIDTPYSDNRGGVSLSIEKIGN